MAENIVSYAERAFDTFDERPFNSVDSLILAWFSYFHLNGAFEGVSDGEALSLTRLYRSELFDDMFRDFWDAPSTKRLFAAVMASRRFRDMRALHYVESFDSAEEKQFAAVSFQLTDELAYVAFRGTDSTLIGWKEDFSMAFKSPVAAQESAARYLGEAAKHLRGALLVGGHSKGGNLAVYAAAECDRAVQDRIARVYSHDGPGFLESVLQRDSFGRIAGRIEKTLPQSSVVGMLLEHQERYSIVKSNRVSFLQHDPFSWLVENNAFVPFSHLTSDAIYLDHTISGWLAQLSEADRARFVDALFEILSANDITTVDEWKAGWPKNVPAAVRALSQMSPDTKAFLINTLRELAALSLRNFPELFRRPVGGRSAASSPLTRTQPGGSAASTSLRACQPDSAPLGGGSSLDV